MKLLRNQPKVIEVAVSRRNLITLLTKFYNFGETSDSLSTLAPDGTLVKLTIDRDDQDRRVPASPPHTELATEIIERCLDKAEREA
jgi:hypothetical protein